MKRILAAGALALLVLAPTASLGASFNVRATNADEWNPFTRTIHKGDKVVWKNPTADLHDMTSYGEGNNWNKDASLPPGAQTSKRFNQRGTYKYFCTKHGHVTNSGVCHGMCGKIKVLGNN